MRNPPVKLLDRVRQSIRLKGYSIRTEKTYESWIKRFILFDGKRHPNEMGKPEIEAFLTHLAVNRNVAAPTQNQALISVWFKSRTFCEAVINSVLTIIRLKI